MPSSRWKTAAGLASLATGTYYFNFFIETVDGSGVYLSATYARADLLIATAVLWLVSLAVSLGVLAVLRPREGAAPAWKSAGLAVFAALMLAVFIRCYLKVAGFGVTDEALTFDWLPMRGPQQWLLAAPVVAVAVLLLWSRRPERSAALLRFLAVCGLVAVPLGAWRLVQMPLGATGLAPLAASSSSAANSAGSTAPRRVLWLVLDEFDPQVAFGDAMDVHAAMPVMTRLRGTGVWMTQAASPAGSTDMSLPALLLGESVSRMVYDGPALATLRTRDERAIPFDTAHSVFGKLPQGAATGSLLGFYHPYCRALAIGACESFGTNMGTRWYDGLANLVPKRFSGILDPMTRITGQQASAWPAMAADATKALTVLHLNLPHLPSRYAERRAGVTARGASDAYRLNLELTDKVVGDIAQAFQQAAPAQEQLLIVSSDHWWRARGRHTPHPALLLLRLRNDGQPLVVDNPVSSQHLAQLALAFLQGDLPSHDAIRQWYLKQPYVPTWIPHAD
ncbi:hypothetical protein [Paucibacter sp. B51]|uniref:hypothetical protein n=1 Tax=Paucibacter sp. B51 TaxID=2993315 RepID=UPI0022EC111C|nr:hypothetical protein [Paucibacter sp. B51]